MSVILRSTKDDNRFSRARSVECAPQAWAAGAVFMLLAACLGLSIDAVNRRLILEQPYLPSSISHLWVRKLKVQSASVDLYLERKGDSVGVEIREQRGEIEVEVVV